MKNATPIIIRLCIAALVYLSEAAAPAYELTGKIVAIADGDTLTLLDSDKVQHRIRFNGIDAPEKGQSYGTKAQDALGKKVHEKTVRVVWKERDRYGRVIGDVYLEDRHINREMVADGLAWWYRRYAPESKALSKAEEEAREAKRGLWRDANPEPPWEHRRKKRASEARKPMP